MIEATAYSGGPSTFWKACSNYKCNTYIDTFRPMSHQGEFHKDSSRTRGNFGGYGSGKTGCDQKEFQKHMFITKGGNGLVTANVSAQYEQTFKREFEADIPAAFIRNYSAQKQFMEFKNGYRLMYRPGDDPGKLRSLNLDFALMMEASEMKAEVYHQLKTRLRNTAATTQLVIDGVPQFEVTKNGDTKPIIDKDWRKSIIESNPDSGWINSDVLLVSHAIHGHGDVQTDYDQDPESLDNSISSHVTNSNMNYYLPDNFIEEVCANKPGWWISRFINGSFKYSEGLVYPRALDCFVPYFAIPRHWKRIIAFDYGLSDDARFVFGAIDPDHAIIYIYKEVSANNNDVKELANLYKMHTRDIPHGLMLTQPIMDPKNNKRDYDKKDLATHFLEYGISFKPGHVSLDARVLRLNTYIERGRIRFMDTCSILKEEFRGYKFPEKSLNKSNKAQDKPVDKDNHSINPVEWICMELPANPDSLELLSYDSLGNVLINSMQQVKKEAWQFSTESFDDYNTDDFGTGDIF